MSHPEWEGNENEPASKRRPSIGDFDQWVQKRMALTIGAIIGLAFLLKTFLSVRYGFTLGLLAGVAVLALIYLAQFYRRRPG